MSRRRDFLKAACSLALVLPGLAGGGRALAAVPPALPPGAVPLGGEMFLVDGWVLTRRDLEEGVDFDAV